MKANGKGERPLITNEQFNLSNVRLGTAALNNSAFQPGLGCSVLYYPHSSSIFQSQRESRWKSGRDSHSIPLLLRPVFARVHRMSRELHIAHELQITEVKAEWRVVWISERWNFYKKFIHQVFNYITSNA